MAFIMRTGFTEGVKTSFDPTVIPPTSLSRARNVRSDESGVLKVRQGAEAINVSLGAGSIQGMISAFDQILVVWNRNVYLIDDNGTPTTLGTGLIGATANDKCELVRWSRNGAEIVYLFAGNGIYETNGVTVQLTTPYAPVGGEDANLLNDGMNNQDLNSGPAQCRLAVLRASLGQRLAVAGFDDSPNTVYLSAPLDATYFPATQILQLPDDGARITGLANWYNSLVIFRDKDIWGFFGSDLEDVNAQLVLQDNSTGCLNNRTIERVPDLGLVFLGKDNIYAFQQLSGVENQAASIPIGDDVTKFLQMAIDDGTNKVTAIYHEREYRISFSDFIEKEERVFRLRIQNQLAWFIDNGPRTEQFIKHNDQLIGSYFNEGRLHKITDSLFDEYETLEGIPVYVAFRREDLQPGPARIKRVFLYILNKGRMADQSLYQFGTSFNEQMFNEGDNPTITLETGTDQDLKISVVVDGEEFFLKDITVHQQRINHLTLSNFEPLEVFEARIRPSLKANYTQIRVTADTPGQLISILGYGIEYKPKGNYKGRRAGVDVVDD